MPMQGLTIFDMRNRGEIAFRFGLGKLKKIKLLAQSI